MGRWVVDILEFSLSHASLSRAALNRRKVLLQFLKMTYSRIVPPKSDSIDFESVEQLIPHIPRSTHEKNWVKSTEKSWIGCPLGLVPWKTAASVNALQLNSVANNEKGYVLHEKDGVNSQAGVWVFPVDFQAHRSEMAELQSQAGLNAPSKQPSERNPVELLLSFNEMSCCVDA